MDACLIKSLFKQYIAADADDAQNSSAGTDQFEANSGAAVKGVWVVRIKLKAFRLLLIITFFFNTGLSPHNCAEEKIAVFSQKPASAVRIVGASGNRLGRIHADGDFRLKVIFD